MNARDTPEIAFPMLGRAHSHTKNSIGAKRSQQCWSRAVLSDTKSSFGFLVLQQTCNTQNLFKPSCTLSGTGQKLHVTVLTCWLEAPLSSLRALLVLFWTRMTAKKHCKAVRAPLPSVYLDISTSVPVYCKLMQKKANEFERKHD